MSGDEQLIASCTSAATGTEAVLTEVQDFSDYQDFNHVGFGSTSEPGAE